MICPEKFWNHNTRFIEIGATDSIIGTSLKLAGLEKYLLLACDRETAKRLKATEP
jgi:hypothetical protein